MFKLGYQIECGNYHKKCLNLKIDMVYVTLKEKHELDTDIRM